MITWTKILFYFNLIADHPISKLILGAFVAWLSVMIVRKIVHDFFKRTDFLESRKEQTLESMINSVAKYVATIGYLFFALSLFVNDLTNLLAGAGIVGIIVGFGAQSLIKDILSGVFLIYEKQLHKGDFITINNKYHGTVEEIGIRFLKLREWSGKLLTISNGEIKEIQNYNIDHMRVIEKVVVSYRENPSHVFEVLENACNKLNEQFSHLLKKDADGNAIEPFQLYGMTSLKGDYHGYEYTIIGLVDDSVYWEAGKQTRKVIAQYMYEHHILMAEESLLLKQKSNNDDSITETT